MVQDVGIALLWIRAVQPVAQAEFLAQLCGVGFGGQEGIRPTLDDELAALEG